MKLRYCIVSFSIVATTGAILAFAPPSGFKMPRMADGHPDLNGTYDIATITPLERPAGQGETLTREQAMQRHAAIMRQNARADAPLSADRSLPPVGGTGQGGGGRGKVGGYDNYWLDGGTEYTVVDGHSARRL